jgi:hypothetical protein
MLVSDIVVENLPEEMKRNQSLYNSCISGAISETDYLAGLKAASMTDIEVRSRHIYDQTQLLGLIESEIVQPDGSGSVCCTGSSCCDTATDNVTKLAQRAAGKVASISVYARKA